MRRHTLALVGIAAAALAGYLLVDEGSPRAADHTDSPGVGTLSGEGDILDLYAFTNNMANKVSLIMTFATGAEANETFSEDVLYIFHLTSSGGGGDPVNYRLECAFVAGNPQTFDCQLTNDADGNDAIATGDIETDVCGSAPTSGGCGEALRVYAGVFDDPFFFNATGFSSTAQAVRDAAAGLEFAETGCPALPGDTAAALIDCLRTNCTEVGGTNGAAEDTFEGLNVKAIVVQVRKDAIDAGGDSLAVWASTEDVDTNDQIDRAGRPAISTALIGAFESDGTTRDQLKDEYNVAADRSRWPADFSDDIAFSLGILDSLDSTAE